MKAWVYTGIILCLLLQGMTGDRGTGTLTAHVLQHGGIDRQYLKYLPAEDFNRSMPVLFCLHGGGGKARGMIRLTKSRFHSLADNSGFIVIYPQGVDKGWNDGRIGDYSTATRENIDDVGFIREIIFELSNTHDIASDRIFATGISNGGFMSMRLACELPQLIRGAAVVAATIGEEFAANCRGEGPVNILIMNGMNDPLVPFSGGYVKVLRKTRGKILSTYDAVNLWVERNGCIRDSETVSMPDADPADGTTIQKISYTNGKDGTSVVLYEIMNGGHTWPGGVQYLGERLIGKTSRDINACEEIWRFFSEAMVQ